MWEVSRVTADEGLRDAWDFFVSYAQADRAWAEWIAWTLEDRGYRVLVQAWDFVPGSNWVRGIQTGAEDAARMIAILSRDYLNSVFGSAEWQAVWARDPDGAGRRLLTVRVTACDRPGLLAGVVGADLFGLAESEAKARLLNMIAAAIEGRSKPPAAPDFPPSSRAMPHAVGFPGALPQAWNLPPRNPNFAGRSTELNALAGGLPLRSSATTLSVSGSAGIGKTQLAIEYAYAHAGDYEVVWWIFAEDQNSILDQFTTLAKVLGLNPVGDPEKLRIQVCDTLRGSRGWLLIFDNADSARDIESWLPGGPLPAGVPGHVVVTTRRGGFAALGRVLYLDVLDLEDATAMLRVRAPYLAHDDAGQIAEELDRLPLALAEAAAYLDHSRIPSGEYLELLRSQPADLCMRGLAMGRGDTITTPWDSSLDRIGSASKAAAQFLEVCAYLSPEIIPLDLFTEHAHLLPAPLSSAASDLRAWNDTLAILVDYSMVNRTPAGLMLPRYIQGAIRGRDGRRAMQLPSGPLVVALGLLRADVPGEIAGFPESWPRWAAMLPHVLAATDHMDCLSRRPGRRFANQPAHPARADGSWLLDRAGTYLQAHARLCEARALLERALAITEAACGPNDLLVATRLNNLATVHQDLRQPEQARRLMERALAIEKAAYGPGDHNFVTSLNNLASVLRDLGRPEEARPLAERALAIDESANGPDHPGLATALRNLAMILHDLEELERARSLQEWALAIDERAYTSPHPIVALDLTNLATILHKMGQAELARCLLERAAVINQNIYGQGHPFVATSLTKLAGIRQELDLPETGRVPQGRPLVASRPHSTSPDR
jgi:tetratricopeptide (TPR) repeat protein